MLKFFRLYNKYILVVGVALLMVVFLIQPALQMFYPSPGERVIGKVHGQAVTAGNRATAASELFVLSRLGMMGRTSGKEPLRWLLMVRDARRMGLSASDEQVHAMLQELGVGDRFYGQLRQQISGGGKQFVRQAVRHWLMVQDYRELVRTQTHMPAERRVRMLRMAQQFRQQGNAMGFLQIMAMTAGSPRMSEPLIRHFLANQRTRVSGETVLIDSKRYLGQVPAPSTAQLQKLFEKYKNVLPGKSKPYGFGYRFPDRVKLEYLTIPIEQVRQRISIGEAQALSYYQEHKQQFRQPGSSGGDPNDPSGKNAKADEGSQSSTPTTKPYAQVRDQIIERLRRQEANKLAAKMIKAARATLLEQPATRRLPDAGAYKEIPPDYQPMPLEQAAQQVQKRYHVKPTVWRRFADQWTPVSRLDQLPGLGQSHLASRSDVSLATYVKSAKGMHPKPDSPAAQLTPLRFQVGLPSDPLRSSDGSYALLRLTAAQPARTPRNLSEVRQQVSKDARQLAAYRMLLKNRDRWIKLARGQGLQAVAKKVGGSTINVPPTPRAAVQMAGQGGVIPGVRAGGALLQEMFELGRKLASAQKMEVEKAPKDQRIGSAAVQKKLQLAVFRVDGFKPITTGQYKRRADSPTLGAMLSQRMLSTPDQPNPLSLKAIEQRVGWSSKEERGS